MRHINIQSSSQKKFRTELSPNIPFSAKNNKIHSSQSFLNEPRVKNTLSKEMKAELENQKEEKIQRKIRELFRKPEDQREINKFISKPKKEGAISPSYRQQQLKYDLGQNYNSNHNIY